MIAMPAVHPSCSRTFSPTHTIPKPLILDPAQALLVQHLLLFASALIAVVPIQKHKTKYKHGGKCRLPRNPVNTVGATNSSWMKSLFGAFLVERIFRNLAWQNERFSKSLQGNICFKEGAQSPPSSVLLPLPPSGLAVTTGPWHAGQGTTRWWLHPSHATCSQLVLGPPKMGRGNPVLHCYPVWGYNAGTGTQWEMFPILMTAFAALEHPHNHSCPGTQPGNQRVD